MLFNSFEFLLFLPIVFALYWTASRSRRLQNLLLVAASYVFYGWWDWRFTALLALTTTLAYAGGRLMTRHSRRKKAIALIVVIANLTILGFFKYFNFFADSLQPVLGVFGFHPDAVTLNVILPVGISFYTFQAISYTIDVYRRRLSPSTDIVAFFAYVGFFPQLVAGPIERAADLLPQLERRRVFDYAQAVDGMRQMLWGFFKKMVVADNCAIAVNYIWSDYTRADSATLLTGALLFSFQIYGDFSGYSDIAVGCARLFGIRLTANFRFPYFATDIQEFWRRWHVTLMRWFADYVYIPLGGSRCSRLKHTRNIVIVFAVSGLWHGAAWTFVAWGLYHSALMLGLFLWKHFATEHSGRLMPKLLGGMATFAAVTVGWVIFRAPTLSDALTYLGGIFAFTGGSFGGWSALRLHLTLTSIVVLMAVEWRGSHREHALQIKHEKSPAVGMLMRFAAYLCLAMSIGAFSGTQSQFIYFQF